MFENVATGIDEIESKTAELRATATIGRTAKAIFGSVATSRIADAKCAMNKSLEWQTSGGMDGANVGEREFAGKDNLGVTCGLKEAGTFGCAVVHLSRGMKSYGGKVEGKKSEILRYKCVDARFIKFADKPLHIADLIIVKNGVESYVDTGTENVGVLTKLTYVVDAVACSRACTECRATNIDGVCSVPNRLKTRGQILGGS